MEGSAQTRWESCLQLIRGRVNKKDYETWFEPIQIISYDGQTLTFGLPSKYFYEFLSEHFGGLIYQAVRRVFGERTQLKYSLTDQTSHVTVNIEPVRQTVPPQHVAVAEEAAERGDRQVRVSLPQGLDPQLNPNYSFDNFIEGASNKLPRSVGQAIAEHPRQSTFNPLFIYGASGVGKTHLVNAIGAKIKELHPEKRVLYVSAHLFQVQYTDSVRKNTVNDFINFYQTIDVLIIDDVQEFASLTKTQNTFFHIFNHLHQNGRQLILTSDRLPNQILFNMNRRFRQQPLGRVTSGQSKYAVQQSHRECGTRSDSAAGGDIPVVNHRNPFRKMEILQHRTDRRMLNLLHRPDIFDSGIHRPVLVFKKRRQLPDIEKTVFIDCARQHTASIFPEVLRKIASASKKRDPIGRSGNNHTRLLLFLERYSSIMLRIPSSRAMRGRHDDHA